MRVRRAGVSVIMAALAALVQGHEASAGGLWGGRGVPRVGVEQALIVFDAQAGREHLLREIRFLSAVDPFAFVVPVPSAPEVARVDARPFAHLRSSWPYERPGEPAVALHQSSLDSGGFEGLLGSIGTIGHGSGTGRLSSGPGVSVLSADRVGSFTVTVFKPGEREALRAWLKEQKYAAQPSSEAWLEAVPAGFHLIAFRYEKQARDAPLEMKSETVRISFATPQPYYPYRESIQPGGGVTSYQRGLRVWMIANAPHRPVAVHHEGALGRFLRPWDEGMRFDAARGALTDPYLASLLPAGERLWVQVFVDTKLSRLGWSDAILVPDAPVALSDDERARRRPLLEALLAPRPAGAP